MHADQTQATFLFTDIEGSTRIARRAGTDRWMDAIGEHHRIVGEAITANGGRVDRTEGDAFVAVFSEATAAVLAATHAQLGLARHEWPEGVGRLRVRMGIHTGAVMSHSTGYLGLDAHLAARVATAANGGQTLLTAAALAAHGPGDAIEVRDLGAHRLKDFPEPERLYHLVVAEIDGGEVPAPRSASIRPTNLPPQTRALVGREVERARLTELLRGAPGQIVTLTGIGGIGKTRLAVAVGGELLDEFPGGVFLVRLAGVRDDESIVPMIAEAVGVTGESDQPLARVLAQRLSEPRTLIILDNFEQLVSGSTILSDLLAGEGELRVLVTSQIPLRVAAEHLVALGPLARDDAVRLFVQRARTVLPEFSPTEDDHVAIGSICTQLDSMPLAIELAAARVGLLGPQELERRLERPLGLLTHGERDAPERQRSLRATIEWTHALLDPQQQAMFARLGVFAGAVPLSAVEAIASPRAASDQTLDVLDGLLEFSFVRRREDRRHGLRFSVPQALRDFALERLARLSEEDQVRRLHAEHVAGLAYAARLWKFGATTEQRANLLAVTDEIRPAVAWARAHDPELHVRICASLATYWGFSGVLSEVAEELRHARESGAGSVPDRAMTLTLLAKFAQFSGAHDTVAQLADQALAEWRSVDDEHERAHGLGPLSWVFRWDEQYDEAVALAQESLEIYRRSGDRTLVLRGLVYLSHAMLDSRDFAATETVLREAEELACGDPVWQLAAIYGDIAHLRGDDLAAIELYAANLSWSSADGEIHQTLMDLGCLAASLARFGDSQAALEITELVRLEEERTGRVGDSGNSDEFLGDAVAVAQERAGAAAAHSAASRAREVPVAQRAGRALELAADALAAVGVAPHIQD
jgi:predicted ATPase/class 3 adenylate cyclase